MLQRVSLLRAAIENRACYGSGDRLLDHCLLINYLRICVCLWISAIAGHPIAGERRRALLVRAWELSHRVLYRHFICGGSILLFRR